MHKSIVANTMKEFVESLEKAIKDGYSVVQGTTAFEAGYWKVLTQKEGVVEVEEDIGSRMTITVLDATTAVEMLDNPSKPNEKLKEILELDAVAEAGTQLEVKDGSFVAHKPKRNRKEK